MSSPGPIHLELFRLIFMLGATELWRLAKGPELFTCSAESLVISTLIFLLTLDGLVTFLIVLDYLSYLELVSLILGFINLLSYAFYIREELVLFVLLISVFSSKVLLY